MPHNMVLRDVAKIGFLLTALAVDLIRWTSVWHSQGAGWDISLMPKLFWVLAAALIVAAYVRNNALRICLAIGFAASTLLVQSTQMAIGVNVSYFDFVTIVDARSAFEDAFATHGSSMILSGVPAIMVFIGVAIRPRKIPRLNSWFTAAVPLFAIIGLSSILYLRDGKTGGLPAPFLGLGYAALYGIDYGFGNTGQRQLVSIPLNGPKPKGDLVLIIDESVSANYLDLTNPNGARSGLLESNTNWEAANFGIAASITNCSINTNVALRFGATRKDYQRMIATQPSIWAYAKEAGLRTVYLYGQRGGHNENYVSNAERMEMDEALYFEQHAPRIRDHVIADSLSDLINNDVPEFILINKYGVHFPLSDIVPVVESPITQPDRITPAFLSDALENRGGWTQYRQDYQKALEWSVGGFFDQLSRRISSDAPPFTMIYTSDHGQSFNERGGTGINTHCTKEPTMEEGVVPLVVITNQASAKADWAIAANQGKDRRSHYRIFPSLLKLMGYQPTAIRDVYGPEIEAPEIDPMTFGVEMHLRLGIPPRWKTIKPECVVRPDVQNTSILQIEGEELIHTRQNCC